MALGGDPKALRFCLERIYLTRKNRPVAFALPPITGARDAADLMAAITKVVATGKHPFSLLLRPAASCLLPSPELLVRLLTAGLGER
jgi:hypothetical protein